MTIKDLARETGYSIGTVSRVLNHHPNVSEKAREQILSCARQMGFELNTNAKNLKQLHGSGILAVVTGTSNELFFSMIEQIQQALSGANHPLMVEYVTENENAVLHAVRMCQVKKPAGLLFLGGDRRYFRQDFDKISVPSVLLTLDAAELGLPNLSSVATDDERAAECAVEYLISCGHRKIGIISGNQECSGPSRSRYRGCQAALSRHGLYLPEAVQVSEYSFESGYQSMVQLLRRHELTAVFAMSDVMAIGAISALRDRGYRVPEDISVFGFDGLPIGEYYYPKLTTICQQTDMISRRGVQLLLEALERPTPARHETVPFQLLVKGSVKTILQKEGTQV